jgi:hypothetical protein
VAVDHAGDVLSSGDPTGGATAWRLAHVDNAPSSAGPAGAFAGVSCPSLSLCVAVDTAGNVLTSTNPTAGAGAWSTAAVDSVGLSGISCPTAGFCAAVDKAGDVVTSSNPSGGAAAWTRTRIGATQLTALSCVSASFCAAADTGGDVITSTNPGGGSTAWTAARVDTATFDCGHGSICNAYLQGISCPAQTLCVAADDNGAVFSATDPTGAASAWKSVTTSAGETGAVACGSVSLCVLTAVQGIMISTDPVGDASAWTSETIDGFNSLSAISCVASTVCVAVDDAGHAVTFSAGRTSVAVIDSTVTGDFPMGISCPSPSLCVGVDVAGHVLTSTNPAGGAPAWSSSAVGGTLRGVSCPSATFCAAYDSWGHVVTSTNPLGGQAAWRTTLIDGSCNYCNTAVVRDLVCPSRSLCVAVDNSGHVLTSRDPTAGAQSWNLTQISSTDLWGLACPSVSVCVAADTKGDVFTSINPTGGKSAWNVTQLGPSNSIYGLSCPSTTLCLATGSTVTPTTSGKVFVSTNPTGGRAAWTPESSPFQVSGIACLSTSRCIAAGAESVSAATITTTPIAPAIRSLLRSQLAAPGKAARIPSLRRRGGYRYTARALSAGRLQITWYASHAHAKRVKVAAGSVFFSLAGSAPIKLVLTAAGKRLLGHAYRLRVRATGSFTPIGGSRVQSSTTFTIHR